MQVKLKEEEVEMMQAREVELSSQVEDLKSQL